MKVLLAHNFYRSSAPSGEDIVYRNERTLLESRAEVIPYERHNDDIDIGSLPAKIRTALDGAWSPKTFSEITALIRRTKPDVAHFHNTFPQISPSAFAACQRQGVPVVVTLHNYRFVCPGALLLRDGKPCEDCLGGNLWQALLHRCYRASLSATGAQVWTLVSNRWRGTYNLVNRYIALTQFAADKLAAGGLPAQRIVVKPNFLTPPTESRGGEGGYAVYVGRLSHEKGVFTLIKAWAEVRGVPLRILGDGPLRGQLEEMARSRGLDVEFLGYCDQSEILRVVGGAAFQIVPSECYETFGMVVLEAYGCGTPVLASRIGSLDELVQEGQTGLKFEAGNAKELVAAVRRLVSDPESRRAMGRHARQVFLERYTREANWQQLIRIYRDAREDYESRQARKP